MSCSTDGSPKAALKRLTEGLATESPLMESSDSGASGNIRAFWRPRISSPLRSRRPPPRAQLGTATVGGDMKRGLTHKLGVSPSPGIGETASFQNAPRAAVAGDGTFDLAAALVRTDKRSSLRRWCARSSWRTAMVTR
jgi:hypothetical protein